MIRSQYLRWAVVASLWFITGAAWGRIIHVQPGAAGANSGVSWVSAYSDLQAAMAHAVDGDEIWVSAATYKPTSNLDRSVSFRLGYGVAMYGGFAGSETEREQRDPAINVTILSGELGLASLKTDNTICVVKGANRAILDGFTITGGYCETGFGLPGGMYNNGVSPTVNNCIFSSNAGNGGAMLNVNCAPVISNCVFTDNMTGPAISFGGGAAQYYESSGTLTNCVFKNNICRYEGGALLFSHYQAPVVRGCRFINNVSLTSGFVSGGAIRSEAEFVMTDCIFTGNKAGRGGAVFCYDADIKRCIFSGNTADYGGGAIYCESSFCRLELWDCVFEKNKAMDGGAIYNDYSKTKAINCVFVQNQATNYGGAVCAYKETSEYSTFGNCTFVSNSASYGGAICLNPQKVINRISCTNCIFWEDWATAGATFFNINGVENIYHCVIEGTWVQDGYYDTELRSSGMIAYHPAFAFPASPAGPDGIWLTRDDGLALRSFSQCIDRGTHVSYTEDILGNGHRGMPDLGAYECMTNAAGEWGRYK